MNTKRKITIFQQIEEIVSAILTYDQVIVKLLKVGHK